MDRRSSLTLAEQVDAALEWWREAGVDSDFADEPRNWLAPPEALAAEEAPAPAVTQPAEPAVPPLGGEPKAWPRSLADFGPWWTGSDLLETAGIGPRVPPRGAGEAELMVLVPMPEEGDSDRLLSGPQGRLVANMFGAMGIPEDVAYVAAALPRHARHPDWNALAARRLGAVLAHHVGLVAPKRLLVLGRAMLPLFGHDPAQAGANPRQIEVQGCRVPALVSFGPEALLQRPGFRAALWRGWLEWTGGG